MDEQKAIKLFVEGFVSGRFASGRWGWVDSLNTTLWDAEKIAYFFSLFSLEPNTWERAEAALGDRKDIYWRQVKTYNFNLDSNVDLLVDKLLANNRPDVALEILFWSRGKGREIDCQRILKALKAVLRLGELHKNIDHHNVETLISTLQSNPNISQDDLCQIEWGYLDILKHNHRCRPVALFRQLADSPKYFCELIQVIYISEKEKDAPTKELTDSQKRVVSHASNLLDMWNAPPGLQPDGSLDGKVLRNWIAAVMDETASSGHWRAAMERIGGVLINSPADPDGLWLHRSAAEVLNGKDRGKMREAFRRALFNARGGYVVDGGKSDRELASKYRAKADALNNNGYYLLAETIRNLAERYDRIADGHERQDSLL